MPLRPEQVHDQVDAAIYALEKLTTKEREQKPLPGFGENYNLLLSLAKEAAAGAEDRRWPPMVTIHESVANPTTNARYVEIHSYLRQIQAILNEFIEPSLELLRG